MDLLKRYEWKKMFSADAVYHGIFLSRGQ